jgi:hypothetical protein
MQHFAHLRAALAGFYGIELHKRRRLCETKHAPSPLLYSGVIGGPGRSGSIQSMALREPCRVLN